MDNESYRFKNRMTAICLMGSFCLHKRHRQTRPKGITFATNRWDVYHTLLQKPDCQGPHTSIGIFETPLGYLKPALAAETVTICFAWCSVSDKRSSFNPFKRSVPQPGRLKQTNLNHCRRSSFLMPKMMFRYCKTYTVASGRNTTAIPPLRSVNLGSVHRNKYTPRECHVLSVKVGRTEPNN